MGGRNSGGASNDATPEAKLNREQKITPKYCVQLSAEEREKLQSVVRKGTGAAYKRLNA